jgi:hypothetical protein
VAEIEGENDDDMSSEDELSDAFATLLVDIEEEEVGEQPDSYFTSVKSFFSTESLVTSHINPYVKTLVDDLNNQALVHQLIA